MTRVRARDRAPLPAARRGGPTDGRSYQVEQVLDVVRRDGACQCTALVHDALEEIALALLEGDDLLLDRAGGHEPVDGDRLVLPDAVRPVDGLRLGGRIPPRVEDEDVVGLRQRQAEPTSLEADQERRRITVAEAPDDRGPVRRRAVEVGGCLLYTSDAADE